MNETEENRAEDLLKAFDGYIDARVEMGRPLPMPSTLIVKERERKLEDARAALLPVLEEALNPPVIINGKRLDETDTATERGINQR